MKEEIIAPGLFIIGTQRSGTTLLTRILSSHPAYFAQNELPLKRIFLHADTKQQILENLDTQFATRHEGLSINSFLKKSGFDSWGFKDPQLTEYLPQLELFTDTSKFVLITRDGRGVVNSYIENKWGLGTNAYTGALRWKQEINAQLAFMNKYPEKFIHIHFEDILVDTEQTIRLVCEHIGIPFDDSMMQYFSKKADYKQNEENINTYRKPDKNISSKWKAKLSQKEINIIESVAKDELLKLGHQLQGQPISLSAIEILYYQTHQKVIGWLQLQYRWRKSRG